MGFPPSKVPSWPHGFVVTKGSSADLALLRDFQLVWENLVTSVITTLLTRGLSISAIGCYGYSSSAVIHLAVGRRGLRWLEEVLSSADRASPSALHRLAQTPLILYCQSGHSSLAIWLQSAGRGFIVGQPVAFLVVVSQQGVFVGRPGVCIWPAAEWYLARLCDICDDRLTKV